MDLKMNPAFQIYAMCSAILTLKMLAMGHYTGFLRIKLKAFLNPEDSKQFGEGTGLETSEHPEVERGLRAHRNDLESTLPFFAIGLIYVLMGGAGTLASLLMVGFTTLRVLFSIFYLRGAQPYRSLTFTAAELCLLVMILQILYWALIA
ncbi:MAPEG family protein [Myxococcota bacterium]|nr:MAPEG family protein [Myxococcota bacterium]